MQYIEEQFKQQIKTYKLQFNDIETPMKNSSNVISEVDQTELTFKQSEGQRGVHDHQLTLGQNNSSSQKKVKAKKEEKKRKDLSPLREKITHRPLNLFSADKSDGQSDISKKSKRSLIVDKSEKKLKQSDIKVADSGSTRNLDIFEEQKIKSKLPKDMKKPSLIVIPATHDSKGKDSGNDTPRFKRNNHVVTEEES